MSSMLRLESIDDSDIVDLALSLENLVFQLQHGDFADESFIAYVGEEWNQFLALHEEWRSRPTLNASLRLSFGDTQPVDLTGSVEEVKQDQSGTRMIAWSEDPSITDSAIIANATSSTFTSRGIVPINWLPEKISNQIMPILSFAT